MGLSDLIDGFRLLDSEASGHLNTLSCAWIVLESGLSLSQHIPRPLHAALGQCALQVLPYTHSWSGQTL